MLHFGAEREAVHGVAVAVFESKRTFQEPTSKTLTSPSTVGSPPADAEELAVGGESDGDDDVGEAGDFVAFLAGCGVPDGDFLEAAADQVFAVGRPGHRFDERNMGGLDRRAGVRLESRRKERAKMLPEAAS